MKKYQHRNSENIRFKYVLKGAGIFRIYETAEEAKDHQVIFGGEIINAERQKKREK